MHLCRTIGEANLAEDPFATITLYPFWKYGFAFGGSKGLVLNPSQNDPYKKAVVAPESVSISPKYVSIAPTCLLSKTMSMSELTMDGREPVKALFDRGLTLSCETTQFSIRTRGFRLLNPILCFIL